jgi:hypothetical protein
MKLLLILAGLYVWHQSQQTGAGFLPTAQQDIQDLLAQLQQQNPPTPVYPNPLRMANPAGSGSTGGGVTTSGGLTETFTRPFLSLKPAN